MDRASLRFLYANPSWLWDDMMIVNTTSNINYQSESPGIDWWLKLIFVLVGLQFHDKKMHIFCDSFRLPMLCCRLSSLQITLSITSPCHENHDAIKRLAHSQNGFSCHSSAVADMQLCTIRKLQLHKWVSTADLYYQTCGIMLKNVHAKMSMKTC